MKITFFLGRIHHAIKLLPVASALQNAGATIEILVADNSINIDPTTEYLHHFGIHEFHHARDYLEGYRRVAWGVVDGKNVVRHKSQRDIDKNYYRTAVYRMVPPFWAHHSTTEALRNLYGFSKYLNIQKPDAVFALHENNFFVKTLFYAARQAGIKTYSLQEGMILEREEADLGKYSTGTDYTDTLFSWSAHDKQFYSDPDKIVPVGPSHLDRWIQDIKKPSGNFLIGFRAQFRMDLGYARDSKVIVFAPPRLDLYRGDPFRAMLALAEWTRDRGVGLVIKLHPFQGGIEAVNEQMKSFVHVRVRNDNDGVPPLAAADVLVTQTSTIALEALILGIPVVELDMDYIGLEQPLSKFGAATQIDGSNLDRLFDTKSTTGFVNERFPLADGGSTKRIVDYVLSARAIK